MHYFIPTPDLKTLHVPVINVALTQVVQHDWGCMDISIVPTCEGFVFLHTTRKPLAVHFVLTWESPCTHANN